MDFFAFLFRTTSFVFLYFIKNIIKDLYRFKYVYIYTEILSEITSSYNIHQIELFEEYLLEQALNDMIPINENDFNNFKDIIYDKYNRPGYLIKRNEFFIFQPFNEDENITMYYRQTLDIIDNNQISIENYVKYNYNYVDDNNDKKNNTDNFDIEYNFDDVLEYYNKREENFIVGIIDKNKNKLAYDNNDLFKIRPNIEKISTKKRGTGIYSLKGAVCTTTKDKNSLIKLYNKLSDEKIEKNLTKESLCENIKNRLLYLEKYSTSKDGNKKTYMIIPFNHPIYEFPYNLEDRIKHIIKQLNKFIDINLNITVKKEKDSNNNIFYILLFENNKNIDKKKEYLIENKFELKNNNWIKTIN